MTNFNETKLSRIIARRIVAPADRSQALSLCTPVFCPTHNGVRAASVTIINPNAAISFTSDSSVPGVTNLGVTQTKVDAGLNPFVESNGTLVVSNNGIASGFSSSNYLSMENPYTHDIENISIDAFVPAKITNPVNIVGVTSGVVETLTIQPNGNIEIRKGETVVSNLGKAKLGSEFTVDLSLKANQINVTVKSLREDNSYVMDKFVPNGTVTLLTFGVSSDAGLTIDLNQSNFNIGSMAAVKMFENGRHVSNVGNGDNRIKIDMTKTCRQTYFLPHEVDLESNVYLMEQIKSDFGVKFKKEVNAEILAQITAKKNTLNKITTTGELAALFGNSIATFNLSATGARPSIYKYDNGAPVTYTSSTNQINVDQEVVSTEQTDAMFTTKDVIDVPAMYYVEKPTMILNETDYKSYVSGLCGGGIKSFVPDTINVDGTVTDFSAISAAILGDNSCFAVAFTEPKISRIGDKDFFADNICVEVDYGVELINDKSLFLISKQS